MDSIRIENYFTQPFNACICVQPSDSNVFSKEVLSLLTEINEADNHQCGILWELGVRSLLDKLSNVISLDTMYFLHEFKSLVNFYMVDIGGGSDNAAQSGTYDWYNCRIKLIPVLNATMDLFRIYLKEKSEGGPIDDSEELESIPSLSGSDHISDSDIEAELANHARALLDAEEEELLEMGQEEISSVNWY